MSTHKFRPYFTGPELDYIISCLKSSSNPNIPLIQYLEGFKLKIDHGIVSASLLLKPTIEQKLGLDEETNHRQVIAETTARNLYDIWSMNPDARAKMTPKQLQMIQEYRYTNDLMSPTEENEYELGLISTATTNSTHNAL